jgi:hypothetical protein
VPDEAIEKDAQALLAEYVHARGLTIEAPIAIDDIIEKHLKIGIEFDDTHRLFGVPRSVSGLEPDILGAIFFEKKRIVIDESLDPDENPAKEGAIATRRRTRWVIGAFIVICSAGTRRRPRFLISTRRRSPSAGPARPRRGSNCRPTFMPLAF